MNFQANFGHPNKRALRKESGAFRLAVMGDFSGRANKGELKISDALAKRKPLTVDFDNLDDVIARLNIKLDIPIGSTGSTSISINEIEDFHPDELYKNLEIFAEIARFRNRLKDTATFASAAKEVQELLGDASLPKHEDMKSPQRGAVIPSKDSIDDFSKLIGEPTVRRNTVSSTLDSILKSAVAPYIEPAADPRQDGMVAAVDSALSGMMRTILHHPDFQTMEALWRSVEFLTQRLETDTDLQIVLYDITAEEIAADLNSVEDLKESGLYRLLVEQPMLDANQGALTAITACYTFDQTTSHADLLKRIGQICAAADTTFIASIGLDCLENNAPSSEWKELCTQPEAAYLALTVPKFMLRIPYDKKNKPIEPFDFEELINDGDTSKLLWGHSSILAGLSLGLAYMENGLEDIKCCTNTKMGEMPFYYYTDSDGDQVALPCTEHLLTETKIGQLIQQNLTPIISVRGQPEVRIGSLNLLNGKTLSI